MLIRLGREFRRRGMHRHRRGLTVYWWAVTKGLAQGPTHELDVHWNDEHVALWASVLGLPGATPMPRRPVGSPCPRCAAQPGQASSRRTVLVFEEGAAFRCDDCGDHWLEPTPPEKVKRRPLGG
jgi:hypothetical protein